MQLSQTTHSQLESAKVLDFCRFLSARDEAERESSDLADVFVRRWPLSPSRNLVEHARAMHYKASVPAGSPTGWGSSLMPSELADLPRAYAAYVHPFTLIGRLQDARRAPLNTRIIRSTIAMSFGWLGAGKPAPVTAGNLAGQTLHPSKASGIIVLTDELLRLGAPGSEAFLRDELRRGLVAFLDQAFVDPTAAAVADVSPGSITFGVTPISPSGTTIDDAISDLARLLSEYADGGGHLETVVLMMPSRLSIALGLSGLGQFRDLGRNGGTVAGIPVLASEALTISGSAGAGNMVIAVDAAQLFIADEGGLEVTISRRGTLEMSDAPTNDSTTPTGASMVSLWQTNSVGVKCDRFMTWDIPAGAVAVMDDVNWLAIGSPA